MKTNNKSKVNIVIDCRNINHSGIGTYLKNIIPGLINSSNFVITCMGYQELKNFYWFPLINFILLKSKILSIQEHLELLYKIPKCDIFWSPLFISPFFKFREKKRVVTIHDVSQLANPQHYSFSFIKTPLYKILFNRSAKLSSLIITVSEFSKKEIIKYTNTNPEKVYTILNGVDNEFNANFNFKKIEERFILFVGNILPNKNLLFALKAFSKINNKDIKFYIVGRTNNGVKENKLLSEIQNLDNRIVFTGKVSDEELKNYYANASLFLFPSRYEGFGLPILEAMKFNIPIISSNAASIPEVGGNYVTYFNPNDESELIDKLNNYFDNNIKTPSINYSEHLKDFTWDRTISEHIKLFKNM